MKKLQTAIIETLSDGKCMSSSDIARACSFPVATVRSSLQKLTEKGFLLKVDDPTAPHRALYQLSRKQSGFGVSSILSEFQRLVSLAKYSDAKNLVHS
ncbi:winged helix-turn-helix transcriptional regulator [Erwinia tracheiphila]|uniref:Winged helix-turn-helix transcriptional regulator n=1 Tax=Erwinia tracheiphila TaxID=65700 RepID=A0A345CRL0_9GAMM|nr:winged helix-turn-helix transcriptional regulator [Erwinia tracheiphila]AXF76077.1 winged helix-turn-helix transcriptional regulator [Erwinia tracheiphila]UIA85263.1 winged helix-turn-helix transcriptional regulator [Erwinia tracheiphila]